MLRSNQINNIVIPAKAGIPGPTHVVSPWDTRFRGDDNWSLDRNGESLASITPVILTYNEEANLARTLDGVAWASDIVVVDSFSVDSTLAIAARYPNVRVFQRGFDSHANQWSFAVRETNIGSDWILALDADHVAPPEMRAELARASGDPRQVGYCAEFRYCVFGRPLRASLYPAHVVMFRRGCGGYVQSGHTQRLVIDGQIGRLATKLDHDDRKPLARWLDAQMKYARLEAEFLASRGHAELRAIDRLRRTAWIAPLAVFFHTLLAKGCLFEGWRGWFYVLQRTLFEILFSLAWLEREQNRAAASRATAGSESEYGSINAIAPPAEAGRFGSPTGLGAPRSPLSRV